MKRVVIGKLIKVCSGGRHASWAPRLTDSALCIRAREVNPPGDTTARRDVDRGWTDLPQDSVMPLAAGACHCRARNAVDRVPS